MTRDQELWAIALWLERTHGDDAPAHIAKEVERLDLAGEAEGITMWKQVADRYDRLRSTGPIN